MTYIGISIQSVLQKEKNTRSSSKIFLRNGFRVSALKGASNASWIKRHSVTTASLGS